LAHQKTQTLLLLFDTMGKNTFVTVWWRKSDYLVITGYNAKKNWIQLSM
jgi:hypothetical protein